MTLPNFLIIGAMKAGTTSLHSYLAAHPQVYVPPNKELNFFAAQGTWGRGLPWYIEQFDAAGPDAIAIGEASPAYTMRSAYPGVPERIAQILPDVRLIYVLRDPIARMRSNYLHALANGREHRRVDQALTEDPRYLDVSRYAHQLAAYEPYVDRSRILVLTAEQLRHDRNATLQKVQAFLGLDPWQVADLDGELHATSDKRVPAVWAGRLRLPGDPAPIAARVLRNVLRPGPLAALTAAHPRRAQVRAAVDRALSAAVTRPVRSSDGVPSASVLADLHARLAPEVVAVRDWLGAGFDGWGIA